ncbi:MAG: ACT domain-containing protein [Zoogloeaceae bacterium]|nr:ACT domain-containing protein [Zoogloeaceae bacterium]
MSVLQISVFLQSQPGHLQRVLEAFEAAAINVRGFSAADTGDYGVVRFVLDQPQLGFDVLKKAGFAVAASELLCVHLPDKPGELARVLGIIAGAGINVLYAYSLISTIIALHVDNIAQAEAALQHLPVQLVSQAEIAASVPEATA